MSPFSLVKVLILIVLILIPSHTAAQATSYIGLCSKSWPCDKTLATWRGKPISVGWLEDSFGSACECANTILKQDKPKTIRVHLANGPCLRNNRCESHDVFYGYTIASANRAAKISNSRLRRRLDVLAKRLKQRVEQSKGQLTCYVSPCLECDLNGHARKALISAVSAVLPSCIIVDNPLRASCIAGTVCERHGFNPSLKQPCIADMDGAEANSVIDLETFYNNTKQCDVRFYWTAWMNCNSGSWQTPSSRDCNHSIYKLAKAGRIAWNLLSSP
jgi:hypothetical protein